MTADQLRTEISDLERFCALAIGTPAFDQLITEKFAKQEELRKVVTMEHRIANCGRVAL